MKRSFSRRGILLLLLVSALPLAGCRATKGAAGPVRVLVDGESWSGGSLEAAAEGGLRVYVTLDGEALIDLPFAEAHTVRIVQPGVGENVVSLTGQAVYMQSADCENQDCVNMGEVTRENLELRVMGGFIVCLPHRLSVEVRGE